MPESNQTSPIPSVSERINHLWGKLLEQYPDGVSNTSTTKYNDIRELMASTLSIPAAEIYATGAKTRTSNLDTRFVQGNQAGRHTKVGIAFMQTESALDDAGIKRLSDSAVVTSRKFVDGSDNTQYDCILIFVEHEGGLQLTRVIQPAAGSYYNLLQPHFSDAMLIQVGNASPTAAAGTGKLPDLVNFFITAAKDANLLFRPEDVNRLVASLLSKKFIILTGLAGSGKTKVAQAFARWITPAESFADPFYPGAMLEAARKTYKVTNSDSLGVEFISDENTKVLLPRAIIEQWADYIEQHNVPDTIGAQELRDKIKAGGGSYSPYLHNFETHYKPAAFALLKARKSFVPTKCYELIPVGADWTGGENVLGYPDGLDKENYVIKPALDLILRARTTEDIPHFLILDEMNLSHVERYFADILSAIESEEEIQLHHDSERKASDKSIPNKVVLPKNLFIIGTVNVDETTYMFSPKVLDRANVIEFRVEAGELKSFLDNPAKPDLSKLDSKGAAYGKQFINASKEHVTKFENEIKAAYETEMLMFFKALEGHGAEFGYRVAHEAARFVHFYKLLGSLPDDDVSWFPKAYDCVVFQKFLPKLHGSRAKLGPVLKKLWFLCVNDAKARGADVMKAAEGAARSTDKKSEPSLEVPAGAPYPLSAEKIGRMWRLLNENGFASFAEA